ncbi:MAG: NAD(P)/FAD-dependent oxidoreductase [Anaerolineae bacterium]
MADKHVIIIGAGVAGLAAGCYARMNGYRATIFELHNLPGGLCMAWDRKGYTFDGCIHYLFGSGEGQPFNQMWRELGAVQGRQFVHHDEYQRVTDGEKTLIVYADPDRLEQHMLELSPADAGLIRSFCAGVRQFRHFDMWPLYEKPRALYSGKDWQHFGMKMMPFLMPMLRWALVSAKTFGERFRDPFLRRAVPQMFSWEEAPVMMGMFLLAYVHNRNAGFPVGASLDFARSLERRFLELGGEIQYESQVERILVKDGKATGVRLYSDDVHEADYVVSASDGRTLHYQLLGQEYLTKKIARRYDGHLPMHTQVQVSLGVNRDLSTDPHWVTYLLDEPVELTGAPRMELGVKHYCFDPSLSPEGKSVMEVMVRSDYDYWQNLFGRRVYDSEQREVTDDVVQRIERWYPGLRGDIEVMDEATPLTYERYTNNSWGATTGFLLSREVMPSLIMGMDKRVRGLDNLLLAGHWVEPGGGVPMSAASGRTAIQWICHLDRKPFQAFEPSAKVEASPEPALVAQGA